MQVMFTVLDTDGTRLISQVLPFDSWYEANSYGMTCRNELVKDGMRIEWRKA